MSEEKPERKFLEDVGNVLDSDVEDLDASTCSRLNRARQAALESASPKGRFFFQPALRWAGVVATTVMILGVMYFNIYRPPSEEIAIDPFIEDLEIMVDADDLEFYSQVDFYAWLMEVEKDAV
jgi:Protein of unknown function (DUF3619)